MSFRSTLYCLHGFLGTAVDWQTVFGPAGARVPEAQVVPVDITSGDLAPHEGGLPSWARAFNEQVQSAVLQPNEQRVLLGYSLGGRLALHALVDAPQMWSSAIIVAAHPGLRSMTERASRRIADERWAARFTSEPWEPLITEWNALDVFVGRESPFVRAEKDFSRVHLAGALRYWSLGKQEPLHEHIAQLEIPITWIAGADDLKFLTIARDMNRAAPRVQVIEIKNAAHRVPWENTEEFIHAVRSSLRRNR